jgi:hypothetical protein
MNPGPPSARKTAEALAIQALTFIASDGERLGRFLAASGIGPAEIRSAAGEPEFLAGVLAYLVTDEKLLTDFASATEIDPDTVEQARAVLGGNPWERDSP